MERATTYIFLGLGLMMFIFAALQLSARRKSSVTFSLALLFLCLGYVWMYYGLYRMTRLARVPWLVYSDVAVTFLIGPILYSYAKGLVGDRTRGGVVRYLPALLVVIYLAVFQPGVRTTAPGPIGLNPDPFAIPVIRILNTAGDVLFFAHVIAATVILLRVFPSGAPRFRQHFRGVLIYFCIGLLTLPLFVAGHIMANADVLETGVLVNGANSVYFFFLSYRYPEITQRPIRVAASGSRREPGVGNVDVPAILVRLESAMEIDRWYRDPDIKLQSLSTRLGIQNHQLSYILNQHLHTSFRSYINHFRLREAERLLTEHPDMTVLEVAFSVGFNSRSAFNADFTSATGLSPSAFRRQNASDVRNS